MYFGGSILAKCPHCSGEKRLMHLLSGNTYGAEIWSDGRMIAPMCPELSPIQKCPHCGHYFFLSEVETRTDTNGSDETGWLTLDEAIEANSDFYQIDIEDHGVLLLVTVWAYNDIIRKGEKPTKEQTQWFRERLKQDLELPEIIEDDMLLAELFREIGDRKRCQQILLSVNFKDKWHYNIGREMAKRCAFCPHTEVFRVDKIRHY